MRNRHLTPDPLESLGYSPLAPPGCAPSMALARPLCSPNGLRFGKTTPVSVSVFLDRQERGETEHRHRCKTGNVGHQGYTRGTQRSWPGYIRGAAHSRSGHGVGRSAARRVGTALGTRPPMHDPCQRAPCKPHANRPPLDREAGAGPKSARVPGGSGLHKSLCHFWIIHRAFCA